MTRDVLLALAGCQAMDGNLVIDCQGDRTMAAMVPNLTVTVVHGAVVVENCPMEWTAPMALLPMLTSVQVSNGCVSLPEGSAVSHVCARER